MDRHNQPPGTASYSLQLSEQELMRYRMMAASAADNEAAEWSAAGILPGAGSLMWDAARAPSCDCWRNATGPKDGQSA